MAVFNTLSLTLGGLRQALRGTDEAGRAAPGQLLLEDWSGRQQADGAGSYAAAAGGDADAPPVETGPRYAEAAAPRTPRAREAPAPESSSVSELQNRQGLPQHYTAAKLAAPESSSMSELRYRGLADMELGRPAAAPNGPGGAAGPHGGHGTALTADEERAARAAERRAKFMAEMGVPAEAAAGGGSAPTQR